MEQYGLRKVELDILSFFAIQERQGDTAKDIMLTKHISKAHISKSVDNLKKRGYIVLEEDVLDHRKIHISLTTEGTKVLEQFMQIRNECKEILFQHITQTEKEVLVQILEKMKKNVAEKL